MDIFTTLIGLSCLVSGFFAGALWGELEAHRTIIRYLQDEPVSKDVQESSSGIKSLKVRRKYG